MNKRIYYLLYLLIIFTYIVGLFVDQTADAAKYISICKNLAQGGDWINIQARGIAYDQKPPLLFWLGAISFKIFGYYNWAYKLPTILFSLLGVYSIFRLGKLLYDKTTGKLAALVFCTSEMCFLYNVDVHTDALLTANVIFGIWQLMEFLQFKKWYNFVLGFVGVGLAMMSKGPIGLALPVFAIGGHLVLHKDFKNMFHVRWLLGALILLVVISPALIGLYNQFGLQGIQFYFWKNMAGRIDGSYIGNDRDYFFYIHTMAYILLPWSFFALISFFMELRTHILKKFKVLPSDEFVTIGGSVLFLIILSVAHQKAPHYMMIVTPLISIFTAKWILKIQQTTNFPKLKKVLNSIHYGSLIFIWLLTFIIPVYIWPLKGGWLVWILLLVSFVLFSVFFFRKKNFEQFKIVTVLSAIALNIVLFTVMLPSMFDYNAAIQVCKTYNLEADTGDVLYNFNTQNDEICFYSKGESHFLHSEEEMYRIANNANSWIYTDKEGLEQIKRVNPCFEKFYTYDHNKVSTPNIKFIWPKTRQEALKIRYLLKMGNKNTVYTKKLHFSDGNRVVSAIGQ